MISMAGVGGCATDALSLAPADADMPYVADAAATIGSKAEEPDFKLAPRPELAVLRPPAVSETSQVYGLSELIDVAQRANPTTRIAWDEARDAALAVGLQQATFLPQIAAIVVGGYQKTSNSTALQGPLSVASTTSSSIGSSSTTPSTSGGAASLDGTVEAVSLKWLLFDFGQREAQVNAALARSVAANVSFNGAHQKLIYDVTKPFYEFSAAKALARNSAASKHDADMVREAARAKFKSGVGTSLEVAQAEQLAAQAEYQDVRAHASVRDTYQSLLLAMGVSPVTRFQVEDVSSRPIPRMPRGSLAALVDSALQQRPDLQRAFAAAQASKAEIVAAEADFLPKVFMTASGTNQTGTLDINSLPSVDASAPTSVQTSARNVTVLGGAYIPLYDGGTRAAHLAVARDQADSAMQQFIIVQQAAAHDVVIAANGLRDAIESYRAAGALVAASSTEYSAALAAYRSGIGTITTAIDAAKSLLQARNAQAEAHGSAFNAAATLAFAMGALTSASTHL